MKTPITKKTLEKLRELIEQKEKVNAKIVVVSKKTGKDITFKISGWPDPTFKYHTDYRLLTGYETDYNSFKYCCYVDSDIVSYFHRYNFNNTPGVKGAKWLLTHFYNRNFDKILDESFLYHTGACLKCSRELTDATSIEIGLGPVCRGE